MDERDELKRAVFAIAKAALEKETGYTVTETVNHNCELNVTIRRFPGRMIGVRLSVY